MQRVYPAQYARPQRSVAAHPGEPSSRRPAAKRGPGLTDPRNGEIRTASTDLLPPRGGSLRAPPLFGGLSDATGSNDSGHNNTTNNDPLAAGTGSLATDFEARTNFAYRAIDVTTQTAKALIDRYYSDQPAFSYFQGCSMGGREAMMVTQKLPTYFDGSVTGDPGFMLASMSTRSRRSTRARRRTSRF